MVNSLVSYDLFPASWKGEERGLFSMDNTHQFFLQREGHANHTEFMRQEKWRFCDEIFIWLKSDDKCAYKWTVLPEKSRLLLLHGGEGRVPSGD